MPIIAVVDLHEAILKQKPLGKIDHIMRRKSQIPANLRIPVVSYARSTSIVEPGFIPTSEWVVKF